MDAIDQTTATDPHSDRAPMPIPDSAPTTHGTQRPKRPFASIVRTVSVITSATWLVASLTIGIIVMIPRGDDFDTIQTLTRTENDLSARSYRSAYGGDAYTGIQNAASDTEGAVVDGANRTAERLANVEGSIVASANSLGARLDSSTQQTNMIRLGLGAVVISVGALPLAVITRRS